jgi:RNA polymerase sigma-70 factor (ECF subfamily)
MKLISTDSNNRISSPASHLTDEQIVFRVLAGEKELFSDLLLKFQKGVFNFIFRMVGHYELANDLTQEAFMKAYLSLDKFNNRYKFSTWIFSIASNLTIDYLRKKRIAVYSYEKNHDGSQRSMVERLRSQNYTPIEELENHELKTKIQESIEKLSPEYREIIVLRHMNGFSYEDIASITGLPLGTVKNRIFRARRILKEYLNPYFVSETV